MRDQDGFERILESLYDAMLDDARWPAASARIDEACGLTGSGLLVVDGAKEDARACPLGLHYRGEPRKDLDANTWRTTIRLTSVCRASGGWPTDAWCSSAISTPPRS